MSDPLRLAMVPGAAAVLVLLLDAAIRRPVVGVGVVLAIAAVETWFRPLPGMEFGPFSVYLEDVGLALLSAAAAAHLLRSRTKTPMQRAMLVLAALSVVSIVRGIIGNDLQGALNEARAPLSFLAAALYLLLAPASASLRERLAQFWLALSGFYVVLALVRWGMVATGTASGIWYTPESYGGLRVLWSNEALVLAQTFLILLPAWLDGWLRRRYRWLAGALLVSVGLLQHRSVWIVLVVGLGMLFLRRRAASRRKVLSMATVVLIVGVLFLVAFPAQQQAEHHTDTVAPEPLDSGTWEWRVDGWRSLFAYSGPDGLAEAVIGKPYGSGWWRPSRPFGALVNVSPHNYYVETILRVGAVGLVALIVAYGMTLVRLRRFPGGEPTLLSNSTLRVLLITHLVYFIPYSPGMEQGLMLGMAVAATAGLPASGNRVGSVTGFSR